MRCAATSETRQRRGRGERPNEADGTTSACLEVAKSQRQQGCTDRGGKGRRRVGGRTRARERSAAREDQGREYAREGEAGGAGVETARA
eukprot:3853704-Pleurochrysis_carterae.AAC.2